MATIKDLTWLYMVLKYDDTIFSWPKNILRHGFGICLAYFLLVVCCRLSGLPLMAWFFPTYTSENPKCSSSLLYGFDTIRHHGHVDFFVGSLLFSAIIFSCHQELFPWCISHISYHISCGFGPERWISWKRIFVVRFSQWMVCFLS